MLIPFSLCALTFDVLNSRLATFLAALFLTFSLTKLLSTQNKPQLRFSDKDITGILFGFCSIFTYLFRHSHIYKNHTSIPEEFLSTRFYAFLC